MQQANDFISQSSNLPAASQESVSEFVKSLQGAQTGNEQLDFILKFKKDFSPVATLSEVVQRRLLRRVVDDKDADLARVLNGDTSELSKYMEQLQTELTEENNVNIDFIEAWYDDESDETDFLKHPDHTFKTTHPDSLFSPGDQRMHALYVKLDDEAFAKAWDNARAYADVFKDDPSPLAKKRLGTLTTLMNILGISWEFAAKQNKSQREATWAAAREEKEKMIKEGAALKLELRKDALILKWYSAITNENKRQYQKLIERFSALMKITDGDKKEEELERFYSQFERSLESVKQKEINDTEREIEETESALVKAEDHERLKLQKQLKLKKGMLQRQREGLVELRKTGTRSTDKDAKAIQELILQPLESLRHRTKNEFWNTLQFKGLQRHVVHACVHQLDHLAKKNKLDKIRDVRDALYAATEALRSFGNYVTDEGNAIKFDVLTENSTMRKTDDIDFEKLGIDFNAPPYRGKLKLVENSEDVQKIIQALNKRQIKAKIRSKDLPLEKVTEMVEKTGNDFWEYFVQLVGRDKSKQDEYLQTKEPFELFTDPIIAQMLEQNLKTVIPDRDSMIQIQKVERFFLWALPFIANQASVKNAIMWTRLFATDAIRQYDFSAQKIYEEMTANFEKAKQKSKYMTILACFQDIEQQQKIAREMFSYFAIEPLNDLAKGYKRVPMLANIAELYFYDDLTAYDMCKCSLFYAAVMILCAKRFDEKNENALDILREKTPLLELKEELSPEDTSAREEQQARDRRVERKASAARDELAAESISAARVFDLQEAARTAVSNV